LVGEVSRLSAACADRITNKPKQVNVTEVFRLNRLPTSGDHEIQLRFSELARRSERSVRQFLHRQGRAEPILLFDRSLPLIVVLQAIAELQSASREPSSVAYRSNVAG
jgi:hypothetical protein